ncbi:MAG: ankyrin repeat domain-containing protein [Deltaproteobacteria bacterium]|nr:ankyrin repeat domain-containing protein [Deltaproteobacteria bacterium]
MKPAYPLYLASLWLVFFATSLFAQDDKPNLKPNESLKPFLLGGIQTHEPDHQRWVAALNQAGMNAVQVTVYAHQGPWNTAKLWYARQEPAVVAEIRAARQNGLQVVLVLRVALDHNEPENRFLWHGLIYPETEQATRDWFRIYTDFVAKWGRIAEREGVEVLGIASEMNSLAATLPLHELPELPQYYLDDASQERLRTLVGRSEELFTEDVRVGMGAGDFESLDDFLVERNRAERAWAKTYIFAGAENPVEAMNQRRRLLDGHWRQLVKKVRRVYSGRLTLAANFDNYHEVSFWDELDLMGINAYFPLRESLETPLQEEGLVASWRGVFEKIKAFKESHHLSQEVLFTELGYTRWRGVTVAPWSSEGFIPLWDPEGDPEKDRAFFWAAQPIEPEERALAVRALHHVWSEDPSRLAGILYWKLSSLLDLQRFEPFMLYLGERATHPLFEALTRFSEGTRPLSPLDLDPLHVGGATYRLGVDAIFRDDLEALKALGRKVARRKPPPGRTPLLHLAVRLGRGDLVRYLIKVGARRNQRDPGGFLPIHWACFQSDPELVSPLLPRHKGFWRLRQLWRKPHLRDAHDETPLMKCARLGNVPVARRLIGDGPNQIQAHNDRGQTALHLATARASEEMIALLISGGGNVDTPDQDGLTALHLGARRGEVGIVEALAKISKGNPNREGNRPAHEAAIHGRGDAFRLLFEPEIAGEINIYGQSLLHLAAHGGDLETLKILLRYFPQVDPTDHDGWTPLAFATRNGRAAAVELLLQEGADIGHRNSRGTTVLHLAAARSKPFLLQQLAEQANHIDLVDSDGNTALHHSAGWGHVENVRLLLAAGANIHSRNQDGDTPLDIAEDSEKYRAALLLRTAAEKEPREESSLKIPPEPEKGSPQALRNSPRPSYKPEVTRLHQRYETSSSTTDRSAQNLQRSFSKTSSLGQ